jgi:DNA-dependent RNA polymerase auxiliary subunit epsilon
MYIVAFRLQFPYVWDETQTDRQRESIYLDLDAERKVRKRIEEWNYFKVAEKVSDADFIFLVRFEGSSMEGLAIPFDAYRQHFKDKFDLDALRDAAFGRFLIGPLKLPTLSRLSDRLVQQFREKITPTSP